MVGLFRTFALGVVKDLFAETEILGGDFQVLVLGQIFETTLETMLEGRAELDLSLIHI